MTATLDRKTRRRGSLYTRLAEFQLAFDAIQSVSLLCPYSQLLQRLFSTQPQLTADLIVTDKLTMSTTTETIFIQLGDSVPLRALIEMFIDNPSVFSTKIGGYIRLQRADLIQ